MAAGQGAAVDLVGVLAPDLEHVVVAADEAVLAPEGEQRGGHLLAAGGGRVVVGQVGGGGGAVVLAGGVDRRRVAKAADVFVHRPGVERLAAAAQGAHPAADPAVRVHAEHVLGERLGLGEEKPVPVAQAEGHVGVVEGVPGGDDVQHRDLGDRLRVVEGHPVADPGSPVVADDGELVEAELAHDLDLVCRHRALGVGLVDMAARGLAAVAVAAEVGEDDGVVFGEDGGDVMPHDVGLRVAVEQQDRAAFGVLADEGIYSHSARCEARPFEPAGQRNGHGSLITVTELT